MVHPHSEVCHHGCTGIHKQNIFFTPRLYSSLMECQKPTLSMVDTVFTSPSPQSLLNSCCEVWCTGPQLSQQCVYIPWKPPPENKKVTKRRLHVGPKSKTVVQHEASTGLTSRAHWAIYTHSPPPPGEWGTSTAFLYCYENQRGRCEDTKTINNSQGAISPPKMTSQYLWSAGHGPTVTSVHGLGPNWRHCFPSSTNNHRFPSRFMRK